MSAVPETPDQKRDRSPNFPNIGLTKAVERTAALFARAKRHEVRLADAAFAWGYTPKSSAVLQTAAALLAFGLIEDTGSGEARKVKVSDLGWRILEDGRPGVKEASLAEAALKPKLIADMALQWKSDRPDDTFCISELKFERGFTDDSAKRFLAVFDDTIQYALASKSDKSADAPPSNLDKRTDKDAKPAQNVQVKVGDYVQWTSNGQDQFAPQRRVEWISDDKSHLRVFGSMTGIPMAEVTVVDPPKPPPVMQLPQQEPRGASAYAGRDGDLNVLMTGSRLQITADVDLEGLKRLKEILTRYEGILELLNPPQQKSNPYDFSAFKGGDPDK